MKDRTKIRAGKRIMAVMLSLVMVFGIFSGMKLDAEAREGKVYKLQDLKKGMVLYVGDMIDVSDVTESDGSPHVTKGMLFHKKDSNQGLILKPDGNFPIYKLTSYEDENDGVSYNTFTCAEDYSLDDVSRNIYCLEVIFSVTTFEEENTETPAAPESHTCNFQWVTTIAPQVGVDGLDEYKCVYCGAVQESHPIPASVAAVKDFYGKVKDAPANGTVTYDSGKLYTISDYLLKKLSERSDVAVTVNFEYQNEKHELTFPAGTDFTPVLTDEETMYGYFGVAAKLGLAVVAK